VIRIAFWAFTLMTKLSFDVEYVATEKGMRKLGFYSELTTQN